MKKRAARTGFTAKADAKAAPEVATMADRQFTDLELERSLAGDLSPARTAALAAEATDADRARLAELAREHAEYLRGGRRRRRGPPDRAARRALQARAAPAVGCAGSCRSARSSPRRPRSVLFVQSKKPAPRPDDDDDLRTKGDGVSLVIHSEAAPARDRRHRHARRRRSGSRPRAASPGSSRSSASTARDSTTVYYPYGAREATAIGMERLLPGAIQLDATPGDEPFFALFSTKPFAIDAVLPAVTGAGTLPPGIAMSRVVLHKK